MANYLSPDQIREYTVETGIKKAGGSFRKNFLLAAMGGLFIALAGFGSIVATATVDNTGLAALIAGVVFATGLMMVVIGGGDLFTGNVLIIAAVMDKKVSIARMGLNLLVALLGNLTGSLFGVWLIQASGLLGTANGAIVKKLMLKAAHKMELPFGQALALGILCNLLVCIAVWMMYSAKDTGGKVLACVFPIALFILSGYEHIVANMYTLPAGILAAGNAEWVKMAGIPADALHALSWSHIPANAVPVVLGNLIGGLIIGGVYSVIYPSRTAKATGEQQDKSIRISA